MRVSPSLLALAVLCAAPAAGRAQDAAVTSWAVPLLALTPEQLATLPQHRATLRLGEPPAPHSFEGPLLWDVLSASGAIDPARHRDAARQWLTIRAADGYAAVLAMGEVSPEFAGRPAILAIRMDNAVLDRPRMVVPDERRPGRSVRDVVGVGVAALPEPVR